MAGGPKRHLKRLCAPRNWMLSKMKGVFAPRPRPGPHKLRECIPLLVLLRNRLKYALNARETQFILRQRNVKIDGRIRIDPKFPCGFMDVVEIPKTKDFFRILLDVKRRFALVRISAGEGDNKLCKIVKRITQTHRVPAVVTHDGRTLRYPHPKIVAGDTVVIDTASQQIKDHVKFKPGILAMVTGGKNMGRVGIVCDVEKHPGSFNIVHLRDKEENTFATREANVFAIGRNISNALVKLPKGEGIRKNVILERENKLRRAAKLKKN